MMSINKRVPASSENIRKWQKVITTGFLAQALKSGDAIDLYKATVKFAALIRKSMSDLECRQASVELIIEGSEPSEKN